MGVGPFSLINLPYTRVTLCYLPPGSYDKEPFV